MLLLTIGDPPFTPITRVTALLSLESAIFSVVLSSIHYIRFFHVPVPQVAFCIVSGEPPLAVTRGRTHQFAGFYQG